MQTTEGKKLRFISFNDEVMKKRSERKKKNYSFQNIQSDIEMS